MVWPRSLWDRRLLGLLVVGGAVASGCRSGDGSSNDESPELVGDFVTSDDPADAPYGRLRFDGRGGYAATKQLCRFRCDEQGTYTYDRLTRVLVLHAAMGVTTTFTLRAPTAAALGAPTALQPRDLTSATSSLLGDPAGQVTAFGSCIQSQSSCIPSGNFTRVASAESASDGTSPLPDQTARAGGASVRKLAWGDVRTLKLLSNLKLPKEIIVSWDTRLQNAFVGRLACLAKDAGLKLTVVASTEKLSAAREAAAAGGCEVDAVDGGTDNRSIFIQDFAEILDYSGRLAVMSLAHPYFSATLPETLAAKLDADLIVPPSSFESGLGDLGGNVEALPSGGVYYGDTMGSKLGSFLSAHARPARILTTSWLSVGHVDEYVGIIPAQNACGRSVVYADTAAALGLLASMPASDYENGAAAMRADCAQVKLVCGPRDLEFPQFTQPTLIDSIRHFLKDAKKAPPYTLDDFDVDAPPRARSALSSLLGIGSQPAHLSAHVDEYVHRNLALQRDRVMVGVRRFVADGDVRGSCTDDELLTPVPMLLHDPDGGGAIADSAGVANFMVLRDLVVAPDPYFDAFRAAVTSALTRRGVRLSLLNDFVYHFGLGDIHCGTQVVRDLDHDFRL
jgi:hypothetical protein